MSEPVVAHLTNPYLPMSQSWIYHQFLFLRRYHPMVLCRKKQNLDFFPLEDVHGLPDAPAPLRPLERLGRRLTGYLPMHARLIRRRGARLLHSHSAILGREDYRLARATAVPHVVSCYGADIWHGYDDPRWTAHYHRMFAYTSLFLVEGPAMRDKLVSLGCDPAKVKVHHLGVRLETIPFVPRTVGEDGLVKIFMGGRALEKKGHIFGLQAFAEVAQRRPEARLYILTWGDSDESRRLIDAQRRFIAERNLADRVQLMGQMRHDEYLAFTHQCHIFLSPSVHASSGDAEGGFPVTITELMASGMPVVATDHCDAPQVVIDGRTGFVAPERDVPALAAKLEAMIAAGPDRRADLALHGRRLVEAEYDARKQAARLEAVYDELLCPGDEQ